MAAAASLTIAAEQSSDNLYPFWIAGTLKTRLTNFATVCLTQFPDSDVKGHPSANWSILMANLANQISGAGTFQQLNLAISYVYRMCYMTQQLLTQALIGAPQGAAVLASYNLQF